MALTFPLTRRGYCDRRLTLVRYTSKYYDYGSGWKISLSLHPYMFYVRRSYCEFRATVMGINLHFRAR